MYVKCSIYSTVYIFFFLAFVLDKDTLGIADPGFPKLVVQSFVNFSFFASGIPGVPRFAVFLLYCNVFYVLF